MISLTKLSKPFYETDKFWQNKVSDHVEILGTLTTLFQIAGKLLKRSYKPILIYVDAKSKQNIQSVKVSEMSSNLGPWCLTSKICSGLG